MKTDLQKRRDQLEAQLSKVGTELASMRGSRDTLRKSREADAKRVDEATSNKALYEKAYLFLMSEMTERRKQALDGIESMASAALRLVYGPNYQLHFNTFDEKRKEEGMSTFRMELQIESPFETDTLITGVSGERGGGVQEIVAFALRIAALNWLGYGGPLLMDEAYKSMSHDHKIEEVAKFLRQVADATGRQMIFATHKADTFSQYADSIIHVTIDNGASKVTVYDDMGSIPIDEDDEYDDTD
jgi:DNA repair exonuclease SbcCD ATPase subunit